MPAVRRIAFVSGVVQGVGFRPFVARIARAGALGGEVRNEGARVRIDVEGEPDAIARFERRLLDELPPAARIEALRWEGAPARGARGFAIAKSGDAAAGLPLPPDLATCDACLAEVRDPNARRFGYPFTNCTACGPRFTIVERLPYDRARTTMRSFAMCAACAREYGEPDDRRHHAQPIACPACGPALRLTDAGGAVIDEPLAGAVELLRRGRILALKGLGGYQLLCDAADASAVARLRERKRRPDKPLAVMVASVEAARRIARVSDAEARALASAAGPIVLLRSRGAVAAPVAPGLREIGVLLPTTPLHHLLAERLDGALVCTSGNLHEEPIAIDDADARARLDAVADAFLSHDRPIARRADDGVVRVVAGVPRVLRLGRGLGPIAIELGGDRVTRLCVGAHLKSAPALALDGRAVLWPHVGDLDHARARATRSPSRSAIFARSSRRSRARSACDLHPDYASTVFAEGLGLPLRRVAHHEAHVAACLAEHGIEGALGFAWDGFGLGADGALLGGEAIAIDGGRAERVGTLRPFPLPGGDAAARDGRRALAGLLVAAGREGAVDGETSRFTDLARSPRIAPPTSSVGRLFDAVAALSGVRARSSYEGQAAMELEALASPGAAPYPFAVEGGVIDWRPMIAPLLADRADAPRAASRFHATLVAWIAALSEGRPRVALSGGCFQNARLATDALVALEARGIDARLPARVPANDGGLALGQAWIAARRAR